ncbi:MAG: LysR family transcriptional regulator [Cellvibrionaceae bacterium]
MDKLNLINNFLAVARLGRFAAASAHLGVDPSTVSKSIQQLEGYLGVRLFNRTTRKLQLTQAGERYRDKCVDLLGGLELCEQELHLDQQLPKGVLKINLPVAYGQLYIVPMLGRFCDRYPEIQLEVSLTDDYIDMVSHSIDVAIRSGHLNDSRLVARQLSPMDFATCAAPSFLSQTKTINASNIKKQPWILYRFLHTGRTMPIYAISGNGKQRKYSEFSPEPRLIVSDGLSMVTACKSGIGLMQAPHFLVRDAVEKGELEIVQSYYRSENFNVYAYYTHKTYMPAKVRVFLDFLVEELEKIGEDHKTTYLSQ